jgi:hypothetical protein
LRCSDTEFCPDNLSGPKEAFEHRHSSWLELFFDLVFVVAIAEGHAAAQPAEELEQPHDAPFGGARVPVAFARSMSRTESQKPSRRRSGRFNSERVDPQHESPPR